jgi:hypothetical protein
MRLLFVPVADRPECALALQTSFLLAHRLGASLNGCHVRPHSDSKISLPADQLATAEDDAIWEVRLKEQKQSKAGDRAGALFARIAGDHDYTMMTSPRSVPGAVWMEKVGSPQKLLAISGPMCDLIVVSRPATKNSKIAQMFLHSALLSTSRPVLILPRSGKAEVGKRVCIAWNQSTEAASAVAAAIPILQQADQVTIVSCGAETGRGPKSGQLVNYLRYWGIKAKRIKGGSGDEGKALIKSYRDTHSDLLVMGAYSRSRLRQRIFGGVTDFILNKADVPVFVLHH